MNLYRDIFHIITSPKAAWEDIKKFNIPKDILLSKAFYPLLAIISLSVFFRFFYGDENTLSEYLTLAIINVCKYFFGYIISSYLLTSIYIDYIKTKDATNKINVFIIFNYCVLMVLNVICNVLPLNNPIIYFYPIYLVFVIMKGFNFFEFERIDEVKYVVIFSLSIILPSLVIEKVFNFIL